MRLPTLKQLERMGRGDAEAVLDYQEAELRKTLANLPKTYSHLRPGLNAKLRRLLKRREELSKA